MSIPLILLMIAVSVSPDDVSVEAIKDAQATHRAAWSRGRADFRVEITARKTDKPAVVEGHVDWLDSSSILKFKAVDPDAAFFKDRAVGYDQEWNYIARSADFVITYESRRNVFSDRKPGRLSIQPFFELSPFATFALCCVPSPNQERAWDVMVGPVPMQIDAFKEDKFTHRKLENGDHEQTRIGRSGHRTVIVFSLADDFAVKSVELFGPDGGSLSTIGYEYSRDSRKRVVPRSCRFEDRNDRSPIAGWRYVYSNVKLGDSVAPSEFRCDSVTNLISRTTRYGKTRSQGPSREASDELLDALSRDLRESRSNRP